LIVVRRTMHVEPRNQPELVEMIKSIADLKLPNPPHRERVYTYGNFSPWDLVIWEQEFESLAEYEANREGISTEQYKRMFELVEMRGSHTELWKVEHLK